MKRLSIITVCLNERHGIEKTCKSIVSQTWMDFEWIVIDGASTDGTLDVLSRYPVTRLVSEPDGGIYEAMNKGIRLAQGEFVIFLNGGDYFHHPEVLSEVFEKQNYQEDILCGNVLLANSLDKINRPPRNVSSPLVFIGESIPHQAAFIRRRLFTDYGFYDEKLRIVSDWKQWIVFAFNKCRFRNLNLLISVFDDKGISSVRPDLLQQEYIQVVNSFFLHGENYRSVKSIRWVKLLGFLPILKIRRSRNKRKILLFGILPLFSVGDQAWT
ncbi:glycosyltransferase family 2 protein [Akkermansia sp.]|uniref:glycosyltransferase family 2 protein n=1 Tax=Akkermansia sp. TaxID=1872421 RepID=UPI0025BFAA74|nr:glycosyltransferase family 2 protein [Akkermansia sp.]MCC8149348.1 glycosyltransferase [Akkermansia sp.]